MFSFIFGFSGGLYIGTYYSEFCKPYLNRVLDCLKKELNKNTKNINDNENKES